MTTSQHPAWCQPQHCLRAGDDEHVHRHIDHRTHGDTSLTATVSAGDDEQPRLFLAMRDHDGLTLEQAEAIAQQVTEATARLRQITE